MEKIIKARENLLQAMFDYVDSQPNNDEEKRIFNNCRENQSAAEIAKDGLDTEYVIHQFWEFFE